MSRVNRPDTLLTELREVQRRLRLLEGSAARVTMAFSAAETVSFPLAVPLSPVRPVDWPSTESADWESLLRTPAVPGRVGLTLDLVADAETTGQVRVLVGDESVVGGLPVTAESTRHVVELPVPGEAEIVVQARRTAGTGRVRVFALLSQ